MSQPVLWFLSKYWAWGLASLGLVCVVYLVTSIGLLLSSARRNAELREQNRLLRYQNDLLKWVGNKLKDHPSPGDSAPAL